MIKERLSVATLRQNNKSLYWAWKAIKQRCKNPKCRAYKNYGGRGISVCKEWENFEGFFNWAVNSGYKKGLDIDRINNNGDYTPNNCRWVSRTENVNNRRNTILLTVDGKTKARTEWEREAHIPNGVVKSWVSNHGKEYAESRISEILKTGYTEKNYSYSHKKSIKHVESGTIFQSVKEAAACFGIAPCTISNAMRENRATGKGSFTWEEIK